MVLVGAPHADRHIYTADDTTPMQKTPMLLCYATYPPLACVTNLPLPPTYLPGYNKSHTLSSIILRMLQPAHVHTYNASPCFCACVRACICVCVCVCVSMRGFYSAACLRLAPPDVNIACVPGTAQRRTPRNTTRAYFSCAHFVSRFVLSLSLSVCLCVCVGLCRRA